MAEPDPRLPVKVAILDAIDAMIRAKAPMVGRAELAALVAERNRVAKLLGRPTFNRAELLVPGRDDGPSALRRQPAAGHGG